MFPCQIMVVWVSNAFDCLFDGPMTPGSLDTARLMPKADPFQQPARCEHWWRKRSIASGKNQQVGALFHVCGV